MKRRGNLLTSIVLSIAVFVLCGVALAASESAQDTTHPKTGPAGLDFYTPPSSLPSGAHGDVIWVRRLHGGGAALPAAGRNWLVLYRSTDSLGHAVAVSGTVAIPKGDALDGGWPVISWGHGTTGIADICAPSRNSDNFPDGHYVTDINKILNTWVKHGYAVVKTDYQGLGTPGVHQYVNGYTQARNAADIVLAARQIDPDVGGRWVAMGHSQGGQTALFAASIGPVYAQQIDLLGAVAISISGYTSTFVSQLANNPQVDNLPIVAVMLAGLHATNPKLDLDAVVTKQGQKRISKVYTGCLAQLREKDGWNDADGPLVKADADFKPLTQTAATYSDLQGLPYRVPVLMLQEKYDHLIPAGFAEKTVQRMRAAGANVKYIEYSDGPQDAKKPANHRLTVRTSLPDAMAWVAKRFADD